MLGPTIMLETTTRVKTAYILYRLIVMCFVSSLYGYTNPYPLVVLLLTPSLNW